MPLTDKCLHKSNYQSLNKSEEVSSDTENETEEINIVLITEEIDKMKYLLLKHPS